MAENTLGRRERMMLLEFIEKWVDLSGVCDAMVDGQLSQLLFQCLSDGWDEPLANQIIQSCRDAPGGIVTYEELMAYQLPRRQEISLLATDGITLGQNIPFDICHFPSAALAQWIQSYRQIAPYVQIPIDDVCRHIVVVGMSGTGKTFVGMNAAVEIHRTGVPLHIFDPKFDYRALVHHIDDLLVLRADQVLINPLSPPPNVSKTRWAGYLAFALSGQRLIDSLYPLQEAILNCYQHYDTPDFDNLCDELARIFVQSSTFKSGEVHYKREVVLTAIAALRAMKNNFASVFSVKKGFMHEIADRSVVFEIADMVVMPTLLPNLLFWW